MPTTTRRRKAQHDTFVYRMWHIEVRHLTDTERWMPSGIAFGDSEAEALADAQRQFRNRDVRVRDAGTETRVMFSLTVDLSQKAR